MKYEQNFEPQASTFIDDQASIRRGHDVRDGSVYVYSEDIILAVRVAIATGRPLLLRGSPGSGKSSLAAFVARTMNWNYFEQVISSKTQAQDLQWSFDAVRRLRDAQINRLNAKSEAYVEPRVLWWVFDSKSARYRGLNPPLPKRFPKAEAPGVIRGREHPCVILLDEIDKADPDVPNDLLVALGSQEFRVAETGTLVQAKHVPLVFITTNNERDLPRPFLRRCVIIKLKRHDKTDLIKIAKAHFPERAKEKRSLIEALAAIVDSMNESEERATPSTAEYLDAVRACIRLNVEPGDSLEWKAINSAVFAKEFEP